MNAGSGGDTLASDDIGGIKHPRVKIEHGADGSATDVSTASPLPVDQTNTTVADGGALPAKGVQVGGTDGSVFQVISTDSAGRVNTNINGTVTTTGGLTDTQLRATPVPVSGTVTASGPLTDTQLRATPVPVSGTVSITSNSAVNVAQVAGTATDVNSGNKSAGTQRVVLATDQPALTNALKVDGSAVTQPVSGTVTANAGTGPFPVSDNAGSLTVDAPVGTPAFVRLSDGAAAITALPVTDNAGSLTVDNAGTFAVQIAANSSVNAAQVSGTAVSVNSGNKDAGTQRVTLATDQVQLTNALKVDGSATTQPVSGTVTANLAAAAGATGLSKFHLVSAGSTNATNVKASAGKLHGWYIYNSNAAARKVAFHNTAGTPTAGTAVTDSLVIPPTSAANAFTDTGIAFATGIAITTVTDLTDAGTTAVAASDLVINLYFI